jgi:hypothetical protein
MRRSLIVLFLTAASVLFPACEKKAVAEPNDGKPVNLGKQTRLTPSDPPIASPAPQ